jgi:hypothetical protein
MQAMIKKYFMGDIIFTTVAMVAVYFLVGTTAALLTTILLAILEISLSFDNAVVNATVIKDMDEKWRHRFLTWGMLIAVFGMRLVFPLVIVAVIADVSPFEALNLALFKPDDYAAALTSAHLQVAAFGGAFLMMVFWKFFIDEEKEHHWVHVIEAPLAKVGKIDAIQVALSIAVMYVITKFLPENEHLSFWVSGLAGMFTYIIADGFGALMESSEQSMHSNGTTQLAKSGLAMFMYLEILDASFSFDGVIGAFALTNNIFIIAAGLGIGAMFVRSLTIMLVDKGTLEQFEYLEHSAFYAIGVLAMTMFIGTFMHIPESVIGLSSAAIIALGVIHSIYKQRSAIQETVVE